MKASFNRFSSRSVTGLKRERERGKKREVTYIVVLKLVQGKPRTLPRFAFFAKVVGTG